MAMARPFPKHLTWSPGVRFGAAGLLWARRPIGKKEGGAGCYSGAICWKIRADRSPRRKEDLQVMPEDLGLVKYPSADVVWKFKKGAWAQTPKIDWYIVMRVDFLFHRLLFCIKYAGGILFFSLDVSLVVDPRSQNERVTVQDLRFHRRPAVHADLVHVTSFRFKCPFADVVCMFKKEFSPSFCLDVSLKVGPRFQDRRATDSLISPKTHCVYKPCTC
ncbi:hypothetical protein AVEN_135648-1 [Araneus ventricosus]|uniref:Uncharacterized protein n=1 Tax=Araneus ventricosus TaxID=182803 RepID=A0A4Y2EKM5_ARAVE|nr:hypothetical protein AVEN_135648-1 [Araneus ventricosus]